MKALIFIGLLCAGTAQAQTSVLRVSGKDHSCSELQLLVQKHGTVIAKGWLGGEHAFVSGPDQCSPNTEMVLPAYDRSSDQTFCFIGYSCEVDINAD